MLGDRSSCLGIVVLAEVLPQREIAGCSQDRADGLHAPGLLGDLSAGAVILRLHAIRASLRASLGSAGESGMRWRKSPFRFVAGNAGRR